MSDQALELPVDLTQAAFDRCSEDVRLRARNFWYGLRLLPADRFKALCAIYAWMRRADDLADEETDGVSPEDRLVTLKVFRERTHALFASTLEGELPEDEAHIWLAMKQVLETYQLDEADFDSMIDGQVDDITPRTIADMSDLTARRTNLIAACRATSDKIQGWGGTYVGI